MLVKTQDASISTVTVSLQTVKVNNKQMTLAVFRQLPELESIFEVKEYRLIRPVRLLENLSVWGYVLYKIDSTRKWAVVEKDGQLFRSEYPSRWADFSLKTNIEAVTKFMVFGKVSQPLRNMQCRLDDVSLQSTLKELQNSLQELHEFNAIFDSFSEHQQLFIAV